MSAESGPPARGRGDGAPDPGPRLVEDSAGPGRGVAGQPEDRGPDHARLALPDVRLVGRQADQHLQRRLRPGPGRPAPGGARAARSGDLVRDLGHGRSSVRAGDARAALDLERRAPARDGAERLPRGILLHLLLQPDSWRRRRRRRPLLRLHRGDPARPGPKAPSAARRARGKSGRGQVDRTGLRDRRLHAGREPERHPFRAALSSRAGWNPGEARRLVRPRALAPGESPDGRAGRRRRPVGVRSRGARGRGGPRRRSRGAVRPTSKRCLARVAEPRDRAPHGQGEREPPTRRVRGRGNQPASPVSRRLPGVHGARRRADRHGRRERPGVRRGAPPRRSPRPPGRGENRSSSRTSATSSARR